MGNAMPPVLPGERWLPIIGWEGLYEVSDLGRVRSLPRMGGNNRSYGGKLRTLTKWKGYPFLVLTRAGGYRIRVEVHRLVLAAFVGPCPPGMEGCHNNGDEGDARLSNLRWDTHQSNMADTVEHGTHWYGERHGNSKLTYAAVAEIRERYAAGVAGRGPRITHGALAAEYGISPSSITMIINRKAWAA